IEEYRIAEQTAKAALEAAIAELDTIRLKLAHTRITALDDGVVVSRSGVLGDVVSAGTELYRLIRQGRLEWRPEVDARQIAAIRV
ncbi:efflux RND transporter periplasmic adaptor subunit, partial [Klebsiella pneumoniae]|uniref:HlyD family efflux transporter periplasmic adaptor subunit n=1 Tax=Klebsiella pneumoniae TaxID=573 RepID=UPI002761F0A7|nr:efflux RND transporter periplasmic adaptor subunit [Klebsiella pneumoniae]